MRQWTISAVLAVTLMAAGAAWAETPSVLLEKGIYTEETLGDPSSAIPIYKQVVESGEADRQCAAQAQFRLAKCYLKLKQDAAARDALKSLLSKYGDQQELVAQAKPMLEELTDFDPATLMPPETIVYIEVGSPGKQLETVLNMLEGTPFANPLEMVAPPGGTTQPTSPSGEKSFSQIMGALLNPRMMKEFKKLRSMAIGVTDIKQGQAPLVAVLRPGDSDAVSGIVTAAVLAAGRPIAPIEQMQAVAFNDEVACAFDEDVFIFASPISRLEWAVRQYKLDAPAPSLASENPSFAKLAPVAERKADALTLWANPSATFQAVRKMAPRGDMQEVMIANVFLDFENMEGAAARLRLHENSLSVEASIVYREGHRAVGYDLMRTCRLDQAAFAAVPQGAVGLAAVALLDADRSAAGSVASDAQHEAVQRIIGLDLGRELFHNIQQITLFVMPPSEAALAHPLTKETAILPAMGLAITSRDPGHTLGVLDQLLAIPGRVEMPGDPSAERPAQDRRTYMIGKVGRNQMFVHLAQKGDTTVLAFMPEVLDASLAGIGAPANSLTAGPLSKAISQTTDHNKVIMVSVGGALRWYDAAVIRPRLAARQTSQPATQGPSAADQLADALNETVIRLDTVEQPNALTVRFEIANIPPLKNVFPLLMQYQQELASLNPARGAPSTPKMLNTIASRFTDRLFKRNEQALKELIVPGSPAEAKLASLLQTPNLPHFHVKQVRRVGNEGMALARPDEPEDTKIALLIQLHMESQAEWRVVDLDVMTTEQARERLEMFAGSATAPAVTASPLHKAIVQKELFLGLMAGVKQALEGNDTATALALSSQMMAIISQLPGQVQGSAEVEAAKNALDSVGRLQKALSAKDIEAAKGELGFLDKIRAGWESAFDIAASRAGAEAPPTGAEAPRQKTLKPTSIRFVEALGKPDDEVINQLIMPGSPAEAKLPTLLRSPGLSSFAARGDLLWRLGDEGMVLATSTAGPQAAKALVLRLHMIEEGEWRVVDIDMLPLGEAMQRFGQFIAGAAAPAAPSPQPSPGQGNPKTTGRGL